MQNIAAAQPDRSWQWACTCFLKHSGTLASQLQVQCHACAACGAGHCANGHWLNQQRIWRPSDAFSLTQDQLKLHYRSSHIKTRDCTCSCRVDPPTELDLAHRSLSCCAGRLLYERQCRFAQGNAELQSGLWRQRSTSRGWPCGDCVLTAPLGFSLQNRHLPQACTLRGVSHDLLAAAVGASAIPAVGRAAF